MIRLFYPDEYAESAYSLNYDKLYGLGYRGIVFDIDNTLVAHGAPASEESDSLLRRLTEKGFSVALLSDNSEARVREFLKNVDLPFVNSAKKPRPGAFLRAAALTEQRKDRVVYVGDQVFLDVLGANLAGIDSILVKYIGYYEPGYKGKRRAAEEKILARYKKSARFNKLGLTEGSE